jgi:dimethylargininase
MSGKSRGIALVRRPGPRLAEGLVTYVERSTVDLELAQRQHQAYVAALKSHAWEPREVPPADGCPDAVFVEDALVVCGRLAVLTRPGAASRRREVPSLAEAVTGLVPDIGHIEPPGTVDGGDVLQIGSTVYVGRSTRTNADGIRQLRHLLSTVDRRVVAVPVNGCLHLKSAVTALPDGTVLTYDFDASLFPSARTVPEESGAHVLPLGDEFVLIAASAPRTAELLAELGYSPVVVDISEFEKLEGCVTCLSVLVPANSETSTRRSTLPVSV